MKQKFLSEIRGSLPLNCLYNKVRVGCGGTTLALTSNQPYVICVPYVSLADNKVAQQPDNQRWLAVKGGVTKADIQYYLEDCKEGGFTPKIIVTYDSLPKVTTMINPQDFYILIDEYHILFQQYSFRYNAIRGVLDNYKKFKAFTFMTATPIEIDLVQSYTLTELRSIPFIEEEGWAGDENYLDVKVEAIQCRSIKSKVADIIVKHLRGDIEGNAYFFVNSTNFIDEMFEGGIGLTNSNTRVIYSVNNNAEYNFKRGFTTDEPKKINFLTSTAFEGSDIYDENGVTYIISDAYKKHTLLDISSSVQQIIGRIRNSVYKGRVVHIYSRDRYIGVDACDFEEKQEELANECAKYADSLNEKLTPNEIMGIKAFDSEILPYTVVRNGAVVFDENLVLLDSYQYRIRSQYVCKTSIGDAYRKLEDVDRKLAVDVHTSNWIKSLKDMGIFDNKTTTFVDAVKECREASEKGHIVENTIIRKYSGKFPILNDAIKKLGYEKIATMQYSQKRIKDALLNADNSMDNMQKVVKALNIPNGTWISSADLKKKLQKVYNVLGIKDAVKATEIMRYYSCEEKQKRVDGQKVKGFLIFLPLYRVKN